MSELKKKTIVLSTRGESLLDLMNERDTIRPRLNVSLGSFFFRDNGRTGIRMSTIGTARTPSTILTNPLQVAQESGHHYAKIGTYLFLVGIDKTTGYVAVYRRTEASSTWSKIKDFGSPCNEVGGMFAIGSRLVVIYSNGTNIVQSYSTDYGSTWSVAAVFADGYPLGWWEMPDGVYFRTTCKIRRMDSSGNLSDVWNFTTVVPYSLAYYEGSVWAACTKDNEKTATFGRLGPNGYEEVAKYAKSYTGRPAIGKVGDYLIFSFVNAGNLELHAYDLSDLYHFATLSGFGTTYCDVWSGGKNLDNDLILFASDSAGANWLDNYTTEIQVTPTLGVFRMRKWERETYPEDVIEFRGFLYYVCIDATNNNLLVYQQDDGVASSLAGAVSIATDHIDIGEHIPVGILVHHSGSIGGEDIYPDISVVTYFDDFDGWQDMLGGNACVLSTLNKAAVTAEQLTAMGMSALEYSVSVHATKFRFTKTAINRADRIHFLIEMSADVADAANSPTIFSIEYFY